MVTLNLMNETTIAEIIILVVALGIAFLAARMGRQGSFVWFIDSFAWMGLAYVGQDSMWIGITAGVFALFCQVLFISSAVKHGR